MSNLIFHLNCPGCGKTIDDNDHICPHCGLDLDTSLSPTELQTLAQPHLDKAMKALDSGIHLQDALANCEAAIEYLPESADAHNLRGLILDALGREDEAILAYRQAVALDPNFVEAQKNLADAEEERSGLDTFNLEERKYLSSANWSKNLLIFLAVGMSLLVLTGLIMIVYTVGRQLLVPKKQIVFEPDLSRVATVSRDDLQKTAEILQQRWKSLGYGNLSFTVTDKGQIVGQIPADASPSLINRTKAFGLVEFVDVGETLQMENSTINTDFMSSYFPGSIGKKWHTIMTNQEIKSAVVQQNNGYMISFELTAEGTKIFTEYTSRHVGSYLAIVMDKVVISCPMISNPITTGSGIISGNFSNEAAANLAAQLQTAPLPVPLK